MELLTDELTEREKQVLCLLAKGHHYQGIADKLGITLHTAKTLCSNIRIKLKADTSAQAVSIGHTAGIIV